MNSAIQCLSNTKKLSEYFLTDKFVKDINPTNPLGMQGKIAQYYATLLKKIWSGECSSIAPSSFKSVLENFAPQFSGYRQHDSVCSFVIWLALIFFLARVIGISIGWTP